MPIDRFETATTALRDAADALLDDAEKLLPLLATTKQKLSDCDFAVASLRRSEAIGEGPLNSVAAVQQTHKGLAAALEDFNQHLLKLFDIRRGLTPLHPSVVAALKDVAK